MTFNSRTYKGKRKDLRSRRQLTRHLNWITHVIAWYSVPNECVVGLFMVDDDLYFTSSFTTLEELWDWVHRPLLKGTLLTLTDHNLHQKIDPKARGIYLWKTA